MAGYRPSFTLDEDQKILELIVQSQLYYNLRGVLFWKDLSSVGCLDRTWQSLKNRFQKVILPKLDQSGYTISPLEKRKIQLAWLQTSVEIKNKRKKKSNYSSSDEELDQTVASVATFKKHPINVSSDEERSHGPSHKGPQKNSTLKVKVNKNVSISSVPQPKEKEIVRRVRQS